MTVLRKFLIDNEKKILEISAQKTRELAGRLKTSSELNQGPSLFYRQLIKVLEEKNGESPQQIMLHAAAQHGRKYLGLGYSLSHVVHSYGAICQAITELATLKNVRFAPDEFNILNSCLDIAISAAVSEFQFRSIEANEKREIKHLGFLVHELRTALSSATIAHEMIKAGLVGIGGSTSGVLEENLVRMRNLIDRSLSEVRMRSDSDLYIEKFRLVELFDQIIITAKSDAKKKNQTLLTEIDDKIEMEADRQMIISALANLIQNAIKYTKSNGKIWIRGKREGKMLVIEVEDECGGIEDADIESLFEAYTQKNSDRSGLGLGLAIVQRAVQLSQGTISVESNPGQGCIFILKLPIKIAPKPTKKTSVSGTESVQPNFRKRK